MDSDIKKEVVYSGIVNNNHLIIQHATHTDYEDVMMIDQNVYDGADYLPCSYHEILSDPSYHSFVGLIHNKIVGFVSYSVAGSSKTYTVGVGGRLSAKYRHGGMMVAFIRAVHAVMKKKFPSVQFDWSVAEYLPQVVRTLHVKAGERVVGVWHNFTYLLRLKDIEQVEVPMRCQHVTVKPISLSSLNTILRDSKNISRLCPDGYLISGKLFPSSSQQDDIRATLQQCHIHVSGTDDNLALSSVYMYPCPLGIRIYICYSGHPRVDYVVAHILSGILHCAAVTKTFNANHSEEMPKVSINVTFPLCVNAEEVKAALEPSMYRACSFQHVKGALYKTI